jgi:hypothetical protein
MQPTPFCSSRREYLGQCWKAARQNWIVATVAFISAAYSFFTTFQPLIDIGPSPLPGLPKLPLTWAATIALAAVAFVAIEGGYRLERAEQEKLGKERDAVVALRRNEKLRDDLHRDLLKTPSDRMKLPVGSSRWSKFAHSEVIIRRIDDVSYPNIDDGPGISGWFKLEILDFYHGGLQGILNLQYALLDTLTGKWSLLSDEESAKSFPRRFSKAKVYVTGKIPWRNILHYDMEGDQYFPQPHLYCTFADAGEPYEGRGFFLVSDGYQQELHAEDKLELEALMRLAEEEG